MKCYAVGKPNVAQFGSAGRLGRQGREFKSLHSDTKRAVAGLINIQQGHPYGGCLVF